MGTFIDIVLNFACKEPSQEAGISLEMLLTTIPSIIAVLFSSLTYFSWKRKEKFGYELSRKAKIADEITQTTINIYNELFDNLEKFEQSIEKMNRSYFKFIDSINITAEEWHSELTKRFEETYKIMSDLESMLRENRIYIRKSIIRNSELAYDCIISVYLDFDKHSKTNIDFDGQLVYKQLKKCKYCLRKAQDEIKSIIIAI